MPLMRTGQLNLALTMIIFPTLALSALALPSLTPTGKFPSVEDSAVICYDPRYAIHTPSLDDCAAIINHDIAVAPFLSPKITFSRRPTEAQFGLPHTWTTEQGDCVVTIDVPPLPGQRIAAQTEDASMLDVKRAALEVLMACVLRADHLGGFVGTGRRRKLLVSVQAGERARTGGSGAIG